MSNSLSCITGIITILVSIASIPSQSPFHVPLWASIVVLLIGVNVTISSFYFTLRRIKNEYCPKTKKIKV